MVLKKELKTPLAALSGPAGEANPSAIDTAGGPGVNCLLSLQRRWVSNFLSDPYDKKQP
jgi:hypothetical protein